MKKNKVIAFWKYDLYPYLLSGEVDLKQLPKVWKGKMAYYIPSYSGYYCPEFMLEGKAGDELTNRLKELCQQKRDADKETQTRFQKLLEDELHKFGVR